MEVKKEYRSSGSVEIRDTQGNKTLTGYIALFDVESNPLDGFNEILRRGCFTNSLTTNRDIKALYNHDTSRPLGRTPNTLSVAEDDKGLAFVLDIPDTTTGRDLIELAQRGDVNQASFGFFVVKDAWIDRDGGMLPLRELLEVELLEVSVGCVFPAYNQPETYLRHLDYKKNQHSQRRQLNKLELEILDSQVNSIR